MSRSSCRGAATITPSQEQQWSDEVRYLHSLWHNGPPNPNRPKPIQSHNPQSSNLENPKKRRKKQRKNSIKNNTPPPVLGNDERWLQVPSIPETESGWGKLSSVSNPKLITRVASAEEEAKCTALQLQQRGLSASQLFFSAKKGLPEKGSETDESSDEEEEDGIEGGEEESEEFKFFMRLFTDYDELRSYYEKNSEGGVFCCLVCIGIGNKLGKRFKDCVALVQHSTAIFKTKRKKAHRAFSQVVCRVLGWNVNRLPSIVLSLEDSLGRVLAQNDTQLISKEDDQVKDVVANETIGDGMSWKENALNDQEKALQEGIVGSRDIHYSESKEDRPKDQQEVLQEMIVESRDINDNESMHGLSEMNSEKDGTDKEQELHTVDNNNLDC
ncbi:hypothetical protein GIB67_038723 [Kingdonia uniflora]|uniref:Uncharacterized protein n=1 Tax=Kingdonia uniflora TaxID=39325 RepID=A0A7J7NT15_9MAGN|nr:hypothetical protein GIB67_038723 [Kingdonia uniflora]